MEHTKSARVDAYIPKKLKNRIIEYKRQLETKLNIRLSESKTVELLLITALEGDRSES